MYNVPDKIIEEFRKAKDALMQARKICIISHRSPDGDAVGANLSMRLCLEELGKEVVSACKDPVPQDSMFLKNADKYVTDFNYGDFDVIVSVDCGSIGLVKFIETKPELLSGPKPFINVDHHESNEMFGTIKMVDTDACATSFILYHFYKYCGYKISVDTATCLLHGIYFDTGGLMHSNTTQVVFEAAGDLMSKGARVQKIAKELFHTTPVNKLRLLGRILERTYINEENVTISAVGSADYKACGASSGDTTGAIDFLNAVPGSNYCVLLSENERGLVKGSLRTMRDDVNLSEMAAQWGGGGHPKASGFGIEGHLKPVMTWRVVSGEAGDAHGKDFTF